MSAGSAWGEKTRDAGAESVVRFGEGASMFLGPALLMAAFAGHPGFLGLPLLMESPRAQADLAHLVGYFAFPYLAVVALVLGRMVYGRRSWLALAGGALSLVGIVFMSGVFAVSLVSLTPLFGQSGLMMAVAMLSLLLLVGLMVLAAGLYLSGGRPRRRSGASVFMGSLVILVFVDNDPAMFVGASLMLLGLAPVGVELFRGGETASARRQDPSDKP